MFDVFKTNEVGELVVIVLSGEFNSAYNLQSHIILGCPMKISIGEVRKRISGACGVYDERLLLLFCGQVLSNDKEQVPVEAFELPDAADEDANSFKARLCLSILKDTRAQLEEDDNGLDNINLLQPGSSLDLAPKVKHKRKHKDKGEFNLEVELSSINCNAFTAILTKEGYDNEGAFANMTLEVLRCAGLWIPLSSAKRIFGLCVQRKQALDLKDKASMQPHYRQVEHGHAAGAAAGHGAEPADHTTHHAAVNKADVRREYEQQIIRQKKAAKGAAALLKLGKQADKAASLKEHPEELRKKIEALKEAEESSSEFDEITGIMYGTYSRLRSLNQMAEGGAAGSDRSSAAPSAKPNSASSVVTTGPGSPAKLLRTMRSSSSQPALVSPTKTSRSNHDPFKLGHFPSEAVCHCCSKHFQSVQKNREEYVARRRLQHMVELRVALARLPSARSGFVARTTLATTATQYLRSYHGMPQRSADPALVAQCLDASRLTLGEQREAVLWVQGKEVRDENFLSVVPVTWHSAHRFTRALVDLLEELDSERLQAHEYCDAVVVYQDVSAPFLA